jgi:uncharacterized membrane protein YgcG
MRSRFRVLLTLLGVTAIVAVTAAPALADYDTSDFRYSLFDADYTLTQAADGTSQVTVVETLVAEFPDYDQNRGIVRALPRWNQRVDLNPVVASVVDENGEDLYYEENLTDDFLELALGTDEFVYGSTTYVITYSMQHVVGTFPDVGDDEFYWDVNGTGFGQGIDRVSTTIAVDPAVSATLTGETACFWGPSGATNECALTTTPDPEGGTTFQASQNGLAAGETLTVVVGFVEGTFVQGEKTQQIPREPSVDTPAPLWSIVLTVIAIIAGLIALVGAIVARVRRGSGAPGRGTIIPEYSVPKGLNVMVAAHLVGRGATAIPAELVSLAVRGNLRIIGYPIVDGGGEYTLQFLGTDGADSLDLQILTALFGADPEPGKLRELSDDDVELGTATKAVSDAASASITASGWRVVPKSRGMRWPVIGFLALVLAVVNQIATIAAFSLARSPLISIGVTLVTLVVSIALVQFGNHLSQHGAEMRDHLIGMRVYLTLAEQERFRMLQSPDGAERVDVGDTKQVVKLYEKLLPFAVIWGVEDEWSTELELHAAQTDEDPDWFVGQNGFTAIALTSALRGSSNAMSYTAPSSWETGSGGGSGFSSSFGGTGGGGFSGGGGGGGGGGGR